MPFLMLLRPFIPYLLGALAVFAAYTWAYDRGKSAEHVHTVAAQAELSTRLAEERAYAAKLVLEWDEARDRADQFAKERDAARQDAFKSAKELSAALAHRDAPVPADISRVLERASSAAAGPAATAKPAEAAAADPAVSVGQAVDWAVAVMEWATMCRDRVQAWELFYRGLQVH